MKTNRRKRTGGSPIVLSRIYTILRDPIYAGFFYYDKKRYELSDDLPRMITEAEHKKVIVLLERNNIPKTQHHEAVYSGYISSPFGEYIGCDVKMQLICDCKLKFAYSQKTNCPSCLKVISEIQNPKYLYYKKYVNIKRKKLRSLDKSIKVSSVDEKVIDTTLAEHIKENLTFTDGVLDWAKKYIHEVEDKEVRDKILFEKNRDTRKLEYIEKKAKMRNRLYEGQITYEEYKEDLVRLDKEYSDLAETGSSMKSDWVNKLDKIISVTQIAGDILQNGTYKEKRQLLSDLSPNLIWDEKNLIVINRKSIQKLSEAIKISNQEYAKSEPKNELDKKGLKEKISPISTDFSIMLAWRDAFRTFDWIELYSDTDFHLENICKLSLTGK